MIVLVQNEAETTAGRFRTVLERRSVDFAVVCAPTEPLPPVADVRAAVLLGGAMGAYETEAYPFLAEEAAWAAEASAAGRPVLGVCLGCQLLAAALGGRAYRAARPEAVFAPIELTAAGRRDPVVATLEGRRVLRVHRDTFDLPPGAELLATGDGFHQAFRLGVALGIQPHPEVTVELLEGWIPDPGMQAMLAAAGADGGDLLATFREGDAEAEETAERFFGTWLDVVLDRS